MEQFLTWLFTGKSLAAVTLLVTSRLRQTHAPRPLRQTQEALR
jgi:hypothetical protein